MSRLIFASACKKPQGCFPNNRGSSVLPVSKLQIKNIKLHIVTDIKAKHYIGTFKKQLITVVGR